MKLSGHWNKASHPIRGHVCFRYGTEREELFPCSAWYKCDPMLFEGVVLRVLWFFPCNVVWVRLVFVRENGCVLVLSVYFKNTVHKISLSDY